MKSFRRLLSLAFAGSLLAACAPAFGNPDAPHIVVSLYPVEYLAKEITQDHFEIINVAPMGAEPHDLELSLKDVFYFDTAAASFRFDGIQPAVDQLATELPDVLDLSEEVQVLRVNGTIDPHFWLDPNQMKHVARTISEEARNAQPASAEVFEMNLERILGELDELDEAYREGLSACEFDTFVTGHSAFGYLARAYGLTERSVAGIDPDSEPSPAALNATLQDVGSLGLPAIFAEPGASKIAQVLAQELGVEQYTLDPLEVVVGDESYFSVMERNLSALSKGLQCQ